jgi:hypothetical protein
MKSRLKNLIIILYCRGILNDRAVAFLMKIFCLEAA